MTLENFLISAFPSPKQQTPQKRIVQQPRNGTRGASVKRRTTKAKTATRVDCVADFETTTNPEDCRVWSWGYSDINSPTYDKVTIGTDIKSFIDYISEFNSTCYFHNLKFDGMFIIDWLLKNGYEHTTNRDWRAPGLFKTLISDMGKMFSMTVYWENGRSTEFRDSLKKLPMSIQNIAKSFQLDYVKGELDYELERPVGWVITPEEEDYLRRDVLIAAQAMEEVLNAGMTKLTVASDSMAEYKRLTGAKYFEKTFPVLHESIDKEIRRAYRGGFTYADPRFSGKIVRSGLVLDVNSLYPSVMKFQPLPYGEPQYVEGYVDATASRPLTIFSVTFTAKIKKDHIPCIQIKGSHLFGGTEYLSVIPEPVTLMVTNVDWALYNDHYDIDVLSYGGGWRFHATQGMFDAYINKWSAIKAAEKGGKREIAKLHLNSLYGKFASNPNVTSKIPTLVDNTVKLVRGEDETRAPVYTAAGVFITAYARDLTIRSAQASYDTFAYADTDSLHLLQDTVPEALTVHPTDLGAWKLEYHFENAYYIRAKAYLEKTVTEGYVNRIAGVPVHVSAALTFDDLVEGKVLHGKLAPKHVPGGIVLKDVPFELKLS